MTFGDKRRAFRALQQALTLMRQARDAAVTQASGRLSAMADTAIAIPREMFEQCEWALSHCRMWDDEAGEWYRARMLYCDPAITETHFLLKTCPVFIQK